MYNESTGGFDSVSFASVLFIAAIALLAYITNTVLPFMRRRSYIKAEIKRSDENECLYWQMELRKLYISHIPILGRLFYKRRR